jgi:hypothetical protein
LSPDLSKPRPFGMSTPRILISALLLLLSTASIAQAKAPPDKGDTYAQIAQAIAVQLKKDHVKHVVLTDFVGVDGKLSPFGGWLADRLSAANWAPVDVLDRKHLAAELRGLRSTDTKEFDEKVKELSLSHDTAVISGSYSAAEGGIGVTVASIAWHKLKTFNQMVLRAKVELTDEMRSHMGGSLESLAPTDGIYTEGQGGVGTCECDNQNVDMPYMPLGSGKGNATFWMVINADGHISDISQCKATGTSADDFCTNVLDAPKTYSWACKPAVNVDGVHVPVRKQVHLSFSCIVSSRRCFLDNQNPL